jgi:hypothetical protein
MPKLYAGSFGGDAIEYSQTFRDVRYSVAVTWFGRRFVITGRKWPVPPICLEQSGTGHERRRRGKAFDVAALHSTAWTTRSNFVC